MRASVDGKYYSKTSQYKDLKLSIERKTISLFNPTGFIHQYPLENTIISNRIGNIPRRFNFPDGSTFETRDNEGVDKMLNSIGGYSNWIFSLESKWPVVIFGLFILSSFIYLFIFHFNPWLAKQLAPSVPHSWSIKITEHVIKNLKKRKLFLPPKPDKNMELKKRVLKHFEDLKIDFPNHNIELKFISSPLIKANAMAFPGGQIIITEELLELFNKEEQILGILLHEVGHVYYYHSIKMIIKNLTLGLVASMTSGDGTFVAFSLVILNNRYSREAEREADNFALDQMNQKGIPQKFFAEALTHLKNQSQGLKIPAFLSTHPDIDARIQRAQGL